MALTGVTNRKYISDVIPETKSTNTAQWSYITATVSTPSGAGNITLDPIGQALIYSGTTGEWLIMEDTDTIPVAGDPNVTGAPKVAILAGDQWCAGKNEKDITVTEAGVVATIFVGHGVVVEEAVDFATVDLDSAMTAEKTAFFNQLRLQEVRVKSQATEVTPSYTA